MVAFCLGLLLFLWVLGQVGLPETLAQIRRVGWSFPALLLPSTAMALLLAAAWRWILSPAVPFGHLFLIHTAGETVNVITPLAYLGGEPLKASMIRRFGISLADGLASVIVTKTTTTFAYCLFIFLGLTVALLRSEEFSAALAGGTGAGIFLAVSLLILYYAQRRGLFALLHRAAYWLGVRGEAWMAKRGGLETLDSKIAILYSRRKSLAACLALSFFGWCATAVEAYVFLWAMGTRVDFMTAIIIQALILAVKAVSFFVPGHLGTQEGGTLLIFLGLGLSGEAAMAFSLLRRGREVVWILAGLGVLAGSGWPASKVHSEVERTP
jgi:glycosyltransferase 2 family protein